MILFLAFARVKLAEFQRKSWEKVHFCKEISCRWAAFVKHSYGI